jgi:Xaa-Pro aminopeptidase/phosphoglycolate phosphatase-like HAD superfamily hydrolase
MITCDSLIFDMDGTMWDAVDSYTHIWDVTFKECGVDREPVTRAELLAQMGRHLEDILADIAPAGSDIDRLLEVLDKNERALVPVLGGKLYPGVQATIKRLAESGIKLFMVSNCGSEGLKNFMAYAGLTQYFTDSLTHGGTGQPKDVNIRQIVERYGLKNVFYVGDTAGDCNYAHAAGVGMIGCTFGFGDVTTADYKIDTFTELLDLLNIKVDMTNTLQIFPAADLSDKLQRIFAHMQQLGLDSLLVSDNANKFYLTGRVFSGYIYLTTADKGMTCFVTRNLPLTGERVFAIRKPEQMLEVIEREKLPMPGNTALEINQTSWATVQRLAAALGVEKFGNADTVLMQARSVKTDFEIKLIEECGMKHDRVYSRVPGMYRPGMTDIELQIEIERVSRLEGSIGIMRCTGDDLEINMGNVITGDNADCPSPYDFAMGGGGRASLPVGGDGTMIRPGTSVMVDTNGVFNGYMTDMTRTFSLGKLPELALKAHQLSIDICKEIARLGVPGAECKELYNRAEQMAAEAGMSEYFMGHTTHAGFVGHGMGVAVNEQPVLAPRSKSVLTVGNVIALEPKFVIPHVGAVGVENTYVVTDEGMRCLTHSPEEIIEFA